MPQPDRDSASLRQFNLVNIMVGAFPARREDQLADDPLIVTAGRLNELAGLNFTRRRPP